MIQSEVNINKISNPFKKKVFADRSRISKYYTIVYDVTSEADSRGEGNSRVGKNVTGHIYNWTLKPNPF